jgi:hypothetical protein
MKNYSNSVMAELEKQLRTTHSNEDNMIQSLQLAIKASIASLEQLKSFFKKHNFTSKSEEIEFFKDIKPQLASKLIFYNEIYNIEISKPSGSDKTIRKHYNKELSKLKIFFDENLEFYKYYRTGNTCLDKKYFLRRKYDIRMTLDTSYFQSDYDFTTSHDFKVAKIIANDKIQLYLETSLQKYQNGNQDNQISEANHKGLRWTGSKVALVELMYALHAEGVLNNGNLSLNEIAKNIESAFNLDIGQFNRIYLEIRNRKTMEKTNFLNSLKDNLIKRMDEADEK